MLTVSGALDQALRGQAAAGLSNGMGMGMMDEDDDDDDEDDDDDDEDDEEGGQQDQVPLHKHLHHQVNCSKGLVAPLRRLMRSTLSAHSISKPLG